MPGNLDKLLSSASSALNTDEPALSGDLKNLAGSLLEDMLNMLRMRNGFYTLESALHVFPATSNSQGLGLDNWNNDSLWRGEYRGMANGCLFFAENVFGEQFCIKANKIYTFDSETGELKYLADNFDGWAKEIINSYEALTGYPLAHQWQERNGQLPLGKSLLPKVPFVAGGKFTLDNLYLNDAVEGMKFRAYIVNQIKGLPDGAQIQFKIVD